MSFPTRKNTAESSDFKRRIVIIMKRNRIYTVTLNPSLDYVVGVKDFAVGKTNRAISEQMLAGGKGVNVSTVLNNLGIPTTALGFIGGFVGEEIRRRIEEMGITADFIPAESGNSRINMKLKTETETEINGMGPEISPEKREELFHKLENLQAGDILVLAGSIPASVPDSIYRDIMVRLKGRGIITVVDAAKDLLWKVLPEKPFLIKPNHHELGELFHTEIRTREDACSYAGKLCEMGAQNVLVSLAEEGAVLVTAKGECCKSPAPKGTVVNAVGAGDSMVAGFLSGWLEKKDYEYAFKMGIAAGSASAFSRFLATKEEIMELLKKI